MNLNIVEMEKIAQDAYFSCTDPAGSVLVYEGADEAAIMTPTYEYPSGIFGYIEDHINYYIYNSGGKIYAAWD